MHRLHVLFATLVLLVPSLGRAQAVDLDDGPADTSPGARVDVVLPGAGIAFTSALDEAALQIEGGVTVITRAGHGVRVHVGLSDTDPELDFLDPHPASASFVGFDAAYVRRIRLSGDDRFGVGLDLYAGATVANVSFHQPSGGFCWSGCNTPPPVHETVSDGWHLGANAGASLDTRLSVFVVGLDVRARTVFALERNEPGEQLVQADVTAMLTLGFGFY